MALFGTIAAVWGTFMIGYTIYHAKSKNTDKLKYYDYSKYLVKYKRMNDRLNDQSKGMFK